MKNNLIKFILIASITFNVSILAVAGFFFYRHNRHGLKPCGQMPVREQMILDKISASPGQISAIKEKSAVFYPEMDRKMQEINGYKRKLLFILATDKPDKEKINNAISGISNAQKEMQTALAAHILEEKSLLDSAQQARFFGLLEKSLEKKHKACADDRHE